MERNEDLYRLLRVIPAMVSVTAGPEHKYEFANSQYLKIVGKTQAIIGRSVAEVFPELKGQGILEILDKVYRTGKEYRTNEQLVELDTRNDGKPKKLYFNFVYSALRGTDGKVNGIMSHAVEVSDQVYARLRAQDNEIRYRSLFNSIDEGFCLVEMIYDATGAPIDYRFVETNKVFESQTGLNRVVGKTIKQAVPGIEAFWIERYAKVAATGRAVRFTESSAVMDRWFDVHASRVGSPGQYQVAILFKDITAHKHLEAQQQTAMSQVNEVLESMGDAFIMLDKDWNIVRVNKVYEKISRTKRKDVVGVNFWNVFPDAAHLKYWTEYHKAMTTRRSSHFVERYAPLDIWTETDVFPTSEGGISIFFRDITASRKTQTALRQSEERFRTLIEKSTDAIQLVNPEGKILYSSESLKNVLGYTPAELQGVGVRPYLHPDDVDYFYEKFAEIVAKPKRTILLEYRVKHKDGSWAWIETTGVNHLDTPNIQAIVGTFRNITKRKLNEEQTQYQKSLLESQQEVSPLGIMIVSESGKIMSYNQRFATMWRFPRRMLDTEPDEAVREAVKSQLVHPQGFIDKVNEVYTRQIPNNEQLHFIDGRTFDRYGAPLFGHDKRYRGYVWYFLDVTEEKRANDALKASEKRLQFMAESMPQLVFTAGPDGKVDYFNSQWAEYTGISVKELRRNGVRNLIHPEDLEPNMNQWYKALKTGKGFQNQQRMLRADGTYRHHISHVRPMYDDNGKVLRWVGSITDIEDILVTTARNTELERIAAALEEQRSQLIIVNKAKDEFISLASHQLRTPATGVKQYVGMLLEGYAGEITDEQHRFLKSAYESNERQLKIVNDLLKVASVDSGKVALRLESVPVAPLIKLIFAEMASQFESKQQTITFKHAGDDCVVHADAHLLRMVLENLIDNAHKYTYEGKAIEVSVTKHRNTVRINIRDEGVGIPAGDIEKLGEKFIRLDNPLSTQVGGTGLGLYWVKKVVELHQGTLTITSVEGKGSTFSISLRQFA
ncbi:MAG TPA: PAS domain S-box protein [Candidatus Saccharimonadales bacterium]|jgi:PAS domain S-box-containing protein